MTATEIDRVVPWRGPPRPAMVRTRPAVSRSLPAGSRRRAGRADRVGARRTVRDGQARDALSLWPLEDEAVLRRLAPRGFRRHGSGRSRPDVGSTRIVPLRWADADRRSIALQPRGFCRDYLSDAWERIDEPEVRAKEESIVFRFCWRHVVDVFHVGQHVHDRRQRHGAERAPCQSRWKTSDAIVTASQQPRYDPVPGARSGSLWEILGGDAPCDPPSRPRAMRDECQEGRPDDITRLRADR
jgi:hypothetical protein